MLKVSLDVPSEPYVPGPVVLVVVLALATAGVALLVLRRTPAQGGRP